MANQPSQKQLLTKYECARIVGVRTNQLSMSAPVLVSDIPEHLKSNFMYIATKELIEKKLDIVVKRPLPLNKYYTINVRDMEIPDDLYVLEQMLNV
tara:strand:- start:3952 stop:4239 length:288 start_codon:yes stop_codon:yes gene_type:complete